MAQWFSTRKVRFSNIPLLALLLILFFPLLRCRSIRQRSVSLWSHGPQQHAVDCRQEANLFEKNGLNIDMIFVGVSTVMVQSMLSGSANVGGLGGPAVVSNVLRGGRHHPDRGDGAVFHPVPDGSPADYRDWRPERKKSGSPDSGGRLALRALFRAEQY